MIDGVNIWTINAEGFCPISCDYNPQWCRWISADVYCDTQDGILGTNMYAYCQNDPVNLCDPTGTRIRYGRSIATVRSMFASAAKDASGIRKRLLDSGLDYIVNNYSGAQALGAAEFFMTSLDVLEGLPLDLGMLMGETILDIGAGIAIKKGSIEVLTVVSEALAPRISKYVSIPKTSYAKAASKFSRILPVAGEVLGFGTSIYGDYQYAGGFNKTFWGRAGISLGLSSIDLGLNFTGIGTIPSIVVSLLLMLTEEYIKREIIG